MKMKYYVNILLCILSLSCGSIDVHDKKEAFRRLRLDTDILPAVEHFSILVNRDSLPDTHNTPVLIHVLVSNGTEFPYCSIIATRLHKQYVEARILGETMCNGYKVIFHDRDSTLSSSVLKDVHLKPTEYRMEGDYEPRPVIDGQLYDKTSYGVMYTIKDDASLNFLTMWARSPSEMLEWGIDVREQAK